MTLNKTPKHKHRARSNDKMAQSHKRAIAQATYARSKGAKEKSVTLPQEPWEDKSCDRQIDEQKC